MARAQRNANWVGITGTNGKSTTTALIGHILKLARRNVEVGGNLGTPALTLEPLDQGGIYVLEMSSYQLELTLSITFDVAVLMNITPDHLDRHGGFDGYVGYRLDVGSGLQLGGQILGFYEKIYGENGITASDEGTTKQLRLLAGPTFNFGSETLNDAAFVEILAGINFLKFNEYDLDKDFVWRASVGKRFALAQLRELIEQERSVRQ